MKISPIFYMGNKRRLINKGLIDLFPKNIDCFYEPFAGSAIVSMNVKANSYVINDICKPLYDLYKMFTNYDLDTIVNHINKRIDEYGLPRERTKRNVYADLGKLEEYRNAYVKFRDYYNTNPNILDFYVLTFFSFSQTFRFNVNGEFNMPFGCDCYTEEHNAYIKNGIDLFSDKNTSIYNLSFDNLLSLFDFTSNSFIYFDPPYLGTTAVYNENKQSFSEWTEGIELRFRNLCENLSSKGIKFALSNVYRNKNFVNTSLIEWVEHNSFYVHKFGNYSYVANGKGNADTEEVLIMNYKPLHLNTSISKKLF